MTHRPIISPLRTRLGSTVRWIRTRAGLSQRLSSPIETIGPPLVVLVLVVFARLLPVEAVVREGGPYMLGNDPYSVWSVVSALVAEADGPFDWHSLLSFPARDPLFVASLGWAAELAGGSPDAVAWVLAVFPVVAALATVSLCYGIGRTLTTSHWGGLAVAATLAIVPSHAARTSIGYADHHAFDHVWIALTMFALVWLVSADRPSRSDATTVGASALAVGVAGQVLSWVGGILYVVPVGIALIALGLSATRTDHPARHPLGAALGGMAVASITVWSVHATLGWLDGPTALVPAVLTVGLMAVLGIVRAFTVLKASPSVIALGGLAAATGYAVLVFTTASPITGLLVDGIAYFGLIHPAAEAEPLLAGPGFGLAGTYRLLGLLPVIGVPYFVLVTARTLRSHEPVLLVVVTYAWYFTGLSLVQRRFVAELAIPLAVIVGLGLIDVSWRLGLHDRGTPFVGRRTGLRGRAIATSDRVGWRPAVAVVVVVLVVSTSLGHIDAITEPLGAEDAELETARWMAGYADEQGWAYPENYIFSEWDRNRLFNFVVSGHSRSFYYAQENYEAFLRSSDGDRWYAEFRDRPVGFIVTRDREEPYPPESLHTGLHHHGGSDAPHAGGLGRFQLLYVGDGGSIKVFRPVTGAVLTGRATPGERATVTTTVSPAGAGSPVTYRRAVEVPDAGWYAIRVPHPGPYETPNGTIRVSSAAVRDGRFVGATGPNARWSFDKAGGDIAFDSRGGHHGWVRGATRTAGRSGQGVALGDDGYVTIPNATSLDRDDGFTLAAWVRTDPATDFENDRRWAKLVYNSKSGEYENTSGYQLGLSRGRLVGAVGDGSGASVLRGPRIDDGRWHHVALTWNSSVVRLYVDGAPVAAEAYSGRVPSRETIFLGRTAAHGNRFVGTIDEVRYSHGSDRPFDETSEEHWWGTG